MSDMPVVYYTFRIRHTPTISIENSGFEVLKLMRADARFSNVKVLMLTAKGRDSDRQLALELGADRYIAKPYANKAVIGAVSELLESENKS